MDSFSAPVFDEYAEQYDSRAFPQLAAERSYGLMRDTLPWNALWVAMDIGVGTGLVATRVLQHVHKLVGVDISPAMLAKCRLKVQGDPAVSSKLDLMLRDVTKGEVIDGYEGRCDLVYSNNVLHHVQDLEPLLQTLVGTYLRPGGYFAITDIVTGTWEGPQGEESERLRRDVKHHGFDDARIEALFSGVGLETIDTRDRVFDAVMDPTPHNHSHEHHDAQAEDQSQPSTHTHTHEHGHEHVHTHEHGHEHIHTHDLESKSTEEKQDIDTDLHPPQGRTVRMKLWLGRRL